MLLISGCWYANATTLPAVFIQWLEEYAQDKEQALVDDWCQLAQECIQHPIDLNQTDRETLEKFPFLSDIQIENLLEYRYDRRFFATPYELCLVEGWDENTMALLLPFVTALPIENNATPTVKQFFKQAKQQLTLRCDYLLQEKQGYTQQHYLGKPWAGYAAYQFKHKHFSMAATMEKDAGEPFVGNYNKGFDFYSGHLQLQQIKALKTLVIGDYRTQFGQGLVMGTGSSFFSASNFNSFIQRQNKISGSKSNSETIFLRGIGVTLQSKHWQYTLIGSCKYIDAANGIHRTEKQWLQKQQGYTWCIGANIHADYTHFKLGTTCLYDAFKQTAFLGIDYRSYWKNFQFAGEIACNSKGKVATKHTVLAQLHSKVSWLLQANYYDKDYNNSYGYGIAASSDFEHGKAGILTGVQWQIVKGLQVNACVNWLKTLSEKYRINKPAIAYQSYVNLSYLVTENQQLFFNWQWKQQERNSNNTINGMAQVYRFQKNTLTGKYQGSFLNGLQVKAGLVANHYAFMEQKNAWAYVIYQDIGWKHPYFQCTARLAFFDVPIYDEKITVYENDVLYTFSNTAYYGKGIRFAFNASCFPIKNLGIYLNVSHFYYLNQQQIGSGDETIEGPYKTLFKVLVQYKW